VKGGGGGGEVAIKRIGKIFEEPHVALQTIREIKLLKHLQKHPNVVTVREVIGDCAEMEGLRSVFVVMELMESDLQRVICSSHALSMRHYKSFMCVQGKTQAPPVSYY
jgi:mitogen-activated protein kinase 1/3